MAGDSCANAHSTALSQLSQLAHVGSPFLILPGAGLLDQVLPLRLVGHLDEPALTAFGQHLLHGGWRDTLGAGGGGAVGGRAEQPLLMAYGVTWSPT